MKQIIPFKKELPFKTKVSEITSISLERDIEVTEDKVVSGAFHITGDYKMNEGFISTLQSYSTKDGPGIRTTVFCIGCNLRCAWCANPELMLPGEKYMYFKQRCIRCGSCIKHCHGEISMAEDGCVIDRASIDMDTLRQCEDICPKSAYEKVGTRITSADLAQKLLRDKEF